MILEVLKYILVVLGIIVVGSFIMYALATLMLAIVDPHAKDKNNNEQQTAQINQQIIYQEPKLLNQPQEQQTEKEEVEKSDVKDVDLEKAKQEELALSQGNNFSSLNDEEDAFIKEKQRSIEERISAKKAKEETKNEDEVNLDDIFVDGDEEDYAIDNAEEINNDKSEADDDEDIEALINRILADSDKEEQEEQPQVEEEQVEEEPTKTEETTEDVVVNNSAEQEEKQEQDVVQEQQPEEEQVENNEQEERIKELEEQLARQKEEYENKLKEAEQAKEQEANQKIEQLQKELEEKDKQLQESESKPESTLSVEEYEERLKVLTERLAQNEKELRAVKKEYLPLAKIKKSYEKDKVKLRRKEALVAKQKVVLYGVNNYVDIDEEKAKKLSEDLDLLDGLRLSVQHCEEVLKQNEERYPILENSYNILLSANENLKADIAECNQKIEKLKAEQE